jgi:all-trans-retinol dehydrogenase (NAD+)
LQGIKVRNFIFENSNSFSGAGGLIAYSMSKYAAVGYFESVRNEFKAKHINIKTTTVAPYYVKTNLTRGVEYE